MYILANGIQKLVNLYHHIGALLPHVQLVVSQNP